MLSKFTKRTITGVIYVAAVVACTLSHPLAFGLLFTMCSALTVFEFGRVVNTDSTVRMNSMLCALAAALLSLTTMAYCTRPEHDLRVFIPYMLLVMCLMTAELYRKQPDPISDWACTALSQAYIALPFALLHLLAFHRGPGHTVGYNPMLPLSVFIFLWVSDTGAYCIGRLMGRHRLFPRVSPKKSWEGSIGGVVLTVASSFVIAYYFPVMDIWRWAGLALVVAVTGAWGDLNESLLKRQKGLKDSGHVLPGHGGFLDRFDSMLLAVPAALAYLWIVNS